MTCPFCGNTQLDDLLVRGEVLTDLKFCHACNNVVGQSALWVDDCKPAPPGCVVARTYDEAIRMLRDCDYAVLYLDHDLGETRTGLDLLRQLIAEDRVPPKVECISWNYAGRMNIQAELKAYRSLVRS